MAAGDATELVLLTLPQLRSRNLAKGQEASGHG